VDTASIASVSANRVTLPAGTYRYAAWGVARDVAEHRVRLFDITGGVAVLAGSCVRSAGNNSNAAHVSGRFTVAGSNVFELQHWCNTTGTFGTAVSDGDPERYAQIEFWREEA
jgi:hypothetical protein